MEGEPIVTKIRNIQETKPLNKGFETKSEVKAAAGLRIQIVSKNEILPGMPFQIINNNLKEISEEFAEEIEEEIQTDQNGDSRKSRLTRLTRSPTRPTKTKTNPSHKSRHRPNNKKKNIYMANTLPEEDKINPRLQRRTIRRQSSRRTQRRKNPNRPSSLQTNRKPRKMEEEKLSMDEQEGVEEVRQKYFWEEVNLVVY